MMKGILSMLPNELVVMEILIWLPGKQLARCKCVCKSWLSMIGSPQFLENYRSRQRGLILHWLEEGVTTCRLHFFHSPIRQISEPTQEFSPLHGFEIRSSQAIIGMTQVVDGIICVGVRGAPGSPLRLIILNVCNGERMRIPSPVSNDTSRFHLGNDTSTFHLGYDPTNRVYKLLRMILTPIGSVSGSQILTLRPFGSLSAWRELNLPFLPKSYRFSEYRRSANDGLLCWFWSLEYLLCFDVNKEEFQLVEQPEDIQSRKFMFFRALTHSMGRLALWVSLPKDDDDMISHYVQEDDHGKEWSLGCVDLPGAVKETGRFVIASGNISSAGEMLLMNADPVVGEKSVPVYPFRRYQNTDKKYNDQLFVGKLPDKHPSLHFTRQDHSWEGSFKSSFGRFSCLLESNNLHLPLDDILGGHLTKL